ncbi:MAG TPA: CRTAC1 family protein, partial [Saprospiraceae bacterium]|nr:CRTAC1 family protein [Saprospiraceae bacterium]
MKQATYLLAFIMFLSCKRDADVPNNAQSHPSGFSIALQQLSDEQTGVDFNNTLSDTGNLNVFVWNFLYTGAGVVTGDINNDGLPDIYFAGNQVRDRLYLNKGDFKFEDITVSAGIPDDKKWTTGVTMADVNADGLLDIYVCKNSPTPNRNANRNKLLINLGNNRFSDQAAQYGLADEGLSIQATFFDPDQDGDLDVFLINQPFDQLARYIHPPEVVQAYPITDRFYENVNSHFVDRTMEMQMLDDRYGLGISLGDYDGNGWTDIYLCNDYAQGDVLYMNYRGAFRDELRQRTGHTSLSSMGSDAGDVNNDGWEDIFVSDMAFEDHYRAKTNMEAMQPELFWDIVAKGHHFPYAQNTLQLNRGDGYFTEVAQIGGLSKSDWSWSVLFADLDQDGMQDILITNGILRDMKDNDFSLWMKLTYQGRVGPTNYREVLTHLPSTPVSNKIYRNVDGMRYHDVTQEVDFGDPGFSQGLAYADFDGDGGLDLVVNNINAPAGIFRNSSDQRGNYFILTLEGQGKNKNGLGIPVMLCADGRCTARTMQTTRGYYSSSVPELHFGLGTAYAIDSLIVYWNAQEMTVITGLKANQKLSVRYTVAHKIERTTRQSYNVLLTKGVALPHIHHETPFDDYKDQVLLPYKLSQNGPFIAQADVDGDYLTDIFIGG